MRSLRFQNTLQELRKKAELTQTAVASAVGITACHYALLERGESFPRSKVMGKLLQLLSPNPKKLLRPWDVWKYAFTKCPRSNMSLRYWRYALGITTEELATISGLSKTKLLEVEMGKGIALQEKQKELLTSIIVSRSENKRSVIHWINQKRRLVEKSG